MKRIRLVCEKLTVFPYRQDIAGIYVSLAFQRYIQVQDRTGVCKIFAKKKHLFQVQIITYSAVGGTISAEERICFAST